MTVEWTADRKTDWKAEIPVVVVVGGTCRPFSRVTDEWSDEGDPNEPTDYTIIISFTEQSSVCRLLINISRSWLLKSQSWVEYTRKHSINVDNNHINSGIKIQLKESVDKD